jgi:hypothetical protein
LDKRLDQLEKYIAIGQQDKLAFVDLDPVDAKQAKFENIMLQCYSTKVINLTIFPSIKTMFKTLALQNELKFDYFVLNGWDTALDSIEKQYS